MPYRVHRMCLTAAATRLPCSRRAIVAGLLLIGAAGAGVPAAGQEALPPPSATEEIIAFNDGPASYFGSGQFYSPSLDTVLRIRYATRSYGQEAGNLNLGSFKTYEYGDVLTFYDGQVVLNDKQGVGYNVGAGVRWLTDSTFAVDPQRLMGVSIWADGTSTSADNFFPGVGLSLESLGELWDFRLNGEIPLGNRVQFGDFNPTGEMTYSDNFIVDGLEAFRDEAFLSADVEVARRIADREAWAFGGAYALNGVTDETFGFRAGFRGYAFPDLMLQIAVSQDDIFHTNASFSLVWFVGRTRTDYTPTCTVLDRFREPVLRNDYIVLNQTIQAGAEPLTNDDDENIRVVHVNSNAPAGGDGTFENPLNSIDNVNANSMDGDIVLMWSESNFMGQSMLLRDEQRALGEGDDFMHLVDTSQGTIVLPETSPGAASGARPIIMNSPGDAITLADLNNEVANVEIDGGTRAIVAGPNGAGNPNLHDLAILNTTGDGIVLTPFVRTDTEDTDMDGNTTEEIIEFVTTINQVMFENIGGDDVDIDADSGVNPDLANVTLREAISLTNITSSDGNGIGLDIRNTNMADGSGLLTVSNYNYDGGATSLGAMRFDNIEGTVSASNSDLRNGAAGGVGIDILNSTGALTFNSSVSVDNITGIAARVDGGDADVNFNNAIQNSADSSVVVQNMTGGNVSFLGQITDTGAGIDILNNTGGEVFFLNQVELDTGADDALTVNNNTGAEIDFSGLDITTNGGAGLTATGGGQLSILNIDNNTINVTGNTAVTITDMTIANSGVTFSEVHADGGTNGIVLERNDGTGEIELGMSGGAAGDGGTIQNTTGTGIRVVDSQNVTLQALEVLNTGSMGIEVLHQAANSDPMTVLINSSEVDGTGAGGQGVSVTANSNQRFDLDFTNSDVMNTAGEGMTLNVGGSGAEVDVTMTGLTVNVGNVDAFVADLNASANRDVNFLFDDNNFQANGAAVTAFDLIAQGNTTLNANLTDSTFTNGPGSQYDMLADGGGATINLHLDNNTTAGTYELEVANGATFNVQDLANVDANNTGTVNFTPNMGAFNDIPGPVTQP